MNLSNFTLGEQLEHEVQLSDPQNPETVTATILFNELGVVFRAKDGWGPSKLDIVIPYGAPVYRISERPLAALATHEIYDGVLLHTEREADLHEWLRQTKLQEVLEAVCKSYGAFQNAGVIVGQTLDYKRSPTGRDCLIVNDCIHLNQEKRENRAVLVDINFEEHDEEDFVSRDQLEHFIQKQIKDRKNLKFISLECRELKGSSVLRDGALTQHIHVYLMVDLENGFHEERSKWLSACHNLYYQDFMGASKDVIESHYAMQLQMLGGVDVIGEYDWMHQLADIVPPKNDYYEAACHTFQRAKEAIRGLQALGKYPEFVSVIKRYNEPDPPYQPTEADIKEAIAMGW